MWMCMFAYRMPIDIDLCIEIAVCQIQNEFVRTTWWHQNTISKFPNLYYLRCNNKTTIGQIVRPKKLRHCVWIASIFIWFCFVLLCLTIIRRFFHSCFIFGCVCENLLLFYVYIPQIMRSFFFFFNVRLTVMNQISVRIPETPIECKTE